MFTAGLATAHSTDAALTLIEQLQEYTAFWVGKVQLISAYGFEWNELKSQWPYVFYPTRQ